MNKIKKIVYLFLSIVVVSCSTSNLVLDYSNDTIKPDVELHTKGMTGKTLVGTKKKLRFSSIYSGQIKEGWTKNIDIVDKTPGGLFSKVALERSIYNNLGLDIDDITSKRSDKYQFTIKDSLTTLIAFCFQLYEGKSTNYDYKEKFNFSKGTEQKSDFKVNMICITDSTKNSWNLELKSERKTPDGIFQAFIKEGMAIENGFVTNGRDTISIKQVFLRGKEIEKNKCANIIKIVGGYEFTIKDKILGRVDLYRRTISLMNKKDQNNNIVVATATSLLLRNR